MRPLTFCFRLTSRRLLTGIVCSLPVLAAQAEIITDGSLGPRTELSGHMRIGAELGQQHGANLFHSFRDFHIRQGESATFTGPDTVANVVSRVTGGEASEINGLLRSEVGNADFYFINPAGVMFEPKAELDVPAGFHTGSADYVKLEDGAEFHADLSQASTFSSAPLAAFGFLDQAHGDVTVTGAGEEKGSLIFSEQEGTVTINRPGHETSVDSLATDNMGYGRYPIILNFIINSDQEGLVVKEGRTLSLIGGNIDLRQGNYVREEKDIYEESPVDTHGLGSLTAPGGRIYLAAIQGAAEVGFDDDTPDPQTEGGIIRLTQHALVDISGEGDGTVFIRSGQVEMRDSAIFANTLGNIDGQGIQIQVNTLVLNKAWISTGALGESDAGDLAITTGRLEVLDGAVITASTFAEGNGGNLTINASDSVQVSGKNGERRTGIVVDALPGSSGDAGDLAITTGRLEVLDDGVISANTFSEGKGGSLTINASDSVQISAKNSALLFPTGIFAGAERGSSGDAGDLAITTARLKVLDGGAMIRAFTTGEGNGGSITINASDSVQVSGPTILGESSISVDTYPSERAFFLVGTMPPDIAMVLSGMGGDAGDLVITTARLDILDGAAISASTLSRGKGGNLTINASDSVQVSKSGIFVEAGRFIRPVVLPPPYPIAVRLRNNYSNNNKICRH